ncbi:hypothetical protein FACS1894214_4220 [Planctomycetales bacterium]|nr:hypothetical protein FACS1894214_4220 [Planctomycetales bacterium]
MLEKIFEPDTVEPPVLESESGLGTKFVLRNSQEISAAETLPKRFVLNLPEWPQMPEILAAVKDETEQERQRSKWQEALHRYENQKCDTENNTEPQIIPMPESTHHSSTERPSIQHSGSETNNTETENGEQQIHIIHEPVIQNIEPAQRSEAELPGMLSVRGLTKSYKKGKLIIPVLCGVDLTIGKGEFVSVAGQSGSGKSTFLHLLGTLDKPDSGSIYLKEQRIDNLPRRQRDNIRNRSIGFIFQFYHLLPELTTLENVLSPLMIRENLWRYMTKRKSFIAVLSGVLPACRAARLHPVESLRT